MRDQTEPHKVVNMHCHDCPITLCMVTDIVTDTAFILTLVLGRMQHDNKRLHLLFSVLLLRDIMHLS